MIEIKENPKGGLGFDILHEFEGWKVAFITSAEQYGKLNVVKRHTKTDEAFLLVKGNARLFTSDENEPLTATELKSERLYVVKKNTWHHLKVSEDALLIVVENSNTSKENTESRLLTAEEKEIYK